MSLKGEIMGDKEELSKPILIEDLGMRFPTEGSKGKSRFGIYKCGFCGTNFKANTYDINRGDIKSCGCYNKRRTRETHKTHGLRSTKLYNIWVHIKSRILNSKNKDYINYGGRGITICDEWLDIHNFYNWAMSNGYEENKGLSIDRIDNDRNYEPSNCRWVTPTIQSRNKRMPKNNTSGYKGVYFRKDKDKYAAQICVNKNYIHLGYFKTAIEAGVVYNNYIIENNLEGFNIKEIPQQILIEKENTNGI